MMGQLFHDVSILETAQVIAAAMITGVGPDELSPLKPHHVIMADAFLETSHKVQEEWAGKIQM